MTKFLKFLTIFLISYFQLFMFDSYAQEKIKIGLLVPITGEDQEIGKQIVKSTRIALKDINTKEIEIYLKDTNSNPNKTFESALELKNMGIKIIIGPIFYKNLAYLNEKFLFL